MVTEFNSFKVHNLVQLQEKPKYSNNSMSQDYHPQGLFSFSNVFEKQQDEQQHITHQIHQEKLRIQGFKPPRPLVAVEEGEESRGIQVYHEAAGMLSEMFNFQTTTAATATELLQSQLTHNYRYPNQQSHQQQQPSTTDLGSEWFGNRQGITIAGGSSQVPLGHDAKDLKILNNHDSITHYQRQHDINTAESMQLFLMNPQPRSPSPSTSSHPTTSTLQGFPNPTGGNFGQLICGGASTTANHFNTPNEIGGLNVIERQGLSLSLSSSLQHLGATKVEELRMTGGDMLFFNQGASQNHDQFHVGFGSSLGLVNALRNSKYAKATQELLEEFCRVGRGQIFKKNKVSRNNNNATASNPNSNPSDANNNSSSSKDNLPPLSAADRLEHQRRKVKLLSMLDDVDKRYNHYCEQMQMVVNSFDLVMGFGAAVPYTALAQKAMSRHFKCLKDAIGTQLKQSCELLGEKDASSLGLTKGETPRLKILEQSLRQQRAFHQMGMMEQEAWRPQRGLPERSVNILRAWLFEHFLHPYPSDADKHLLARQTGLSRNQVANWFINARVRLWKPMVEDMYQQEAKEEDDEIIETSQNQNSSSNIAQTPKPSISSSSTNTMTTALTTTGTENKTADAGTITAALDKRSEIINATENDPSIVSLNRHCCSSENQAQHHKSMATRITQNSFPIMQDPNDTRRHGDSRRDVFYRGKISGGDEMSHVEYGTTSMAGSSDIGSTMIKFGTSTAGDVSLTLGLRHAGNLPENSHFFG